jgi:hypothetical protein
MAASSWLMRGDVGNESDLVRELIPTLKKDKLQSDEGDGG